MKSSFKTAVAVSMLVCAGALAVAGCGGSDSSAGTAVTKQQYASALSKLCREAADQYGKLHLDGTITRWKTDGDRALKTQETFTDKFHALRVPAALKKAAQEYGNTNAKLLQDTRDAIAAAKSGDATKFNAAVKQSTADTVPNLAAAQKIGAKGCYPS
jgi:hypothetical protein